MGIIGAWASLAKAPADCDDGNMTARALRLTALSSMTDDLALVAPLVEWGEPRKAGNCVGIAGSLKGPRRAMAATHISPEGEMLMWNGYVLGSKHSVKCVPRH